MKSILFDRLKESACSLDSLQKSVNRVLWVDIAKGISISLVVIWHVIGDSFRFNEALIFIRMPLFFFVGGLFIRAVFAESSDKRFCFKMANFIYLYVVWSAIVFLATVIPFQLYKSGSIDITPLLMIFIDPPATLWFIYALIVSFLILRVTRKIPIGLVLMVSIFLYFWSVDDGNWRELPFYVRVIRLFPFLVIGMISFEFFDKFTARFRRVWPVFFLIFSIFSLVVYFSSNLNSIGPITLMTSLIGIVGILLFSRWLSEISQSNLSLGALFRYIGGASLYVYVMHRVLQFYLIIILKIFGINIEKNTIFGLMFYIFFTITIIVLCAIFGRYIAKRCKFLFEVPIRKDQ